MQTKHTAIVRSINRSIEGINVLTAATHERYSEGLSQLPVNFLLLNHENFKTWNYEQLNLPKNHYFINDIDNYPIDIVLSQNKAGQYQMFKQIADQLSIPLISIEHTVPLDIYGWTEKRTKLMNEMRGDLDVFISKNQCERWMRCPRESNVRIIEHGVDTDSFCPANVKKNGTVITVVNDYINRGKILGFDIYQEVTDGLKKNPIGNTPGFSQQLNKEGLIAEFQKGSVFLNTSRNSPIPCSLLEAMACGVPVVSTATESIPDIIDNSVNGFCSNNTKEIRKNLIWCIENPAQAAIIGMKGRETILERFDLKLHLIDWHNLITETLGINHVA